MVCQGKLTGLLKVIEKSLNSFDQIEERLGHTVSSAYSAAIDPPSSRRHTGSSTLIDCHFEGSLTEKQAHREAEKESSEGGQCMYFFFLHSLHRSLTASGAI